MAVDPGVMEYRLIPAQETRIEIVVVNSRFIVTAAPAFSVQEAKAFISRIRAEFYDATHNVPVYLIGHGSSTIAHCSDDGEPPGTAGRPALAVLQGSGLGNVAVVITRYFGGTRLGTGGLVRAYGDAMREVLNTLPRAAQVSTHTTLLAVPYPLFEQVQGLIGTYHGRILSQDFGVDVTVEARFVVASFAAFQSALAEMSNGALQAEIVQTDEATTMPLNAFDEPA
ncbi:MAG: YigZ family protein [Anaerolineae bacterium]|nr:YigZ family protein [Anaerolineae bacterium]